MRDVSEIVGHDGTKQTENFIHTYMCPRRLRLVIMTTIDINKREKN
jgi:hypothetical protein